MKNDLHELRKALDYDPLAHAEQITGTDYKKDDATTWLGMALMQEQAKTKDALLAANDDTNSWSQSRAEWEGVIERMGFRLLHVEDIPTGEGNKYRIYWAPGILLSTDSYWGDKSVNGATCYLNYRGPRSALHRCSNGWIKGTEPEVWEVSRDARDGLRFALDAMRAEGEILERWIERPFLWLLHYQDSKVEGYDYKAITEKRIALLPDDVRAAITPV